MKVNLKWLYDIRAFACLLICIAAVVTLIGGVYILSPDFVEAATNATQASPVLTGIVERGGQYVVGGLMVGIPAVIFAGVGLKKQSLTRVGAFSLATLYVFIAALRIFTIGLLPLTWLYIAAIGLIVALCRLVID